jgi:hypothetical protein
MPKLPSFLLILAAFAPAQDRVSPDNLGERVIAAVPFIGAGADKDPRRPLFAPNPAEITPERPPLLSYTILAVSDDGKSAIVEFVADDLKSLEPILKSQRTDVKAFRKGHHSKAEIDREFRKWKRDFSSDQAILKR